MEQLSFNWADYIVIGMIFLSIIIGLFRGFIKEALSLAAWIISIWASITFSDHLMAYISPYFQSQTFAHSIAFAAVFFGVLICFAIINFIVFQLVKVTGLSGSDRLIGIIFGAVRGGLVVAILILLAQYINFNKETWWSESKLIPYFEPAAAWLQKFIPEQTKAVKD